jgi:hypothetical protein
MQFHPLKYVSTIIIIIDARLSKIESKILLHQALELTKKHFHNTVIFHDTLNTWNVGKGFPLMKARIIVI